MVILLDIGKEFSIPTLDINDFIISENKAFVGSVSNGLFIYENSEVKHFTSKNGLNGNFVTKIIFDNDNNLIIGTDKGPNKLVDGKILKVKYNGETYPGCSSSYIIDKEWLNCLFHFSWRLYRKR